MGPRGLPNSGSPALPRAARAQHPIQGRSGSAAPRAPRKCPLKAGCSRLQTLRTPHRRPARRNTDGARRPDASHAGRAAGGETPTHSRAQNRGSVARQPQLCPDGEPEAPAHGPPELGIHGVSCSGREGGAEGCVPARRERPCGSDAARLFQGLNLCFIYLTREEIVLSHDSFLSRWRLQHF